MIRVLQSLRSLTRLNDWGTQVSKAIKDTGMVRGRKRHVLLSTDSHNVGNGRDVTTMEISCRLRKTSPGNICLENQQGFHWEELMS